jgi:hypothetical protein
MSATTAVKTAKPEVLKLVDSVPAIEKLLASIKTRGATLQKDIHVAACSILQHVGKHSDVRLVSKLLESMPDMSRKNAIKAWFESFGPVAWNEKGEIKYQPATKLQLATAMGKPFWSFKPEADYVPLDVAKAFDSFVKRLEKDAKETGRDHASLIANLANLRPGDESEERTANNAAVEKQLTRASRATKKAEADKPAAPAVTAEAAPAPEAVAA